MAIFARRLLNLGAAAALASLASPALAALPFGNLVFTQPSGSVMGDQPIEVRVRFTLSPNSVPLDFSSNPLTGVDPGDLPTEGQYFDPGTGQFVTSTFVSYSGAYLNTYFRCSGTFTDSCTTGTNYNFSFWTSSAPGRPSINFLDNFQLAPGASTEYVFGDFLPAPGGAATGTYTFYDTGLTFNVRGLDAAGNDLSAEITLLGSTCPNQDASCAFTRDVTAIPEPSSYALMALGLAGLAWRRRQRR